MSSLVTVLMRRTDLQSNKHHQLRSMRTVLLIRIVSKKWFRNSFFHENRFQQMTEEQLTLDRKCSEHSFNKPFPYA